MPIQIEARRLSGADLGKTVRGFGRKGRPFGFTLRIVTHSENHVMLWSTYEGDEISLCQSLAPSDKLTVTGKPSN